MKKFRFLGLLLAFIMLLSAVLLPARASESNLPVTSGCHSVDAAKMLSPAEQKAATAKAVVLYELKSDTMLYAWNPDAKIYPTSMVKMMTALVAIEQGNLDEIVTVSRAVLNLVPIGILGADLKRGEEISLRDLLYATMVASATDASVVVAAHVGGSVEAFLQLMNDKAQELGCYNTHYGNVHGLHDEQTYTTARDIARLTEAALENEVFREMFCTAEYTMAATNKHEERTIKTTNHMINSQNSKYYDKRVTGGKTGATDQGGRCLTLTAEQNGMEILCVLMGATPTFDANGILTAHGSFEESKILLDEAFQSYEYRQVFFQGQSLTQYPVSGGANDVVTQAAASASTILPVDTDVSQLQWVYSTTDATITAPVESGQKLGTVQAWYGDKCLAQADMVAMNAVKPFQAPVVPEKPDQNRDSGRWMAVLMILLVAAGVIGVIILALRVTHIIRRNMRRRRRQNRLRGKN